MAVYLLHFVPAYAHAAHYMGFAVDVMPRVHAHLQGKGARLTQVATEAGCPLLLVRVWEEGDRTLERKLKNRHGSAPLCPLCCGEPVQMPLLPYMPAYVPTTEAMAHARQAGRAHGDA